MLRIQKLSAFFIFLLLWSGNACSRKSNKVSSNNSRSPASERPNETVTETGTSSVAIHVSDPSKPSSVEIESGALAGFVVNIPANATQNDTKITVKVAEETATKTTYAVSGDKSLNAPISVVVPSDVLSAVTLKSGQQLNVYTAPESSPTSLTQQKSYTSTSNITSDLSVTLATWGTIVLAVESSSTSTSSSTTTSTSTSTSTNTSSNVTVTVQRVYANSNAVDSWLWNYYVDGSTTSNDCNTGSSTTCIHAGELRKVITDESSCSGLTATDSLGVFEWTCAVSSSKATFTTSGFKSGKGLKDLLNDTSWKNNSVTVSGASTTYSSSSAAWWTNTVQALPDSSSGQQVLSTNYIVYTYSAARNTQGYVINADGVAVVDLTSSYMTINSTSSTFTSLGEAGAGQVGTFAIGTQFFNWLEVNIDSSVTNHNAIYYYSSKFNRVHNTIVRGGGVNGATYAQIHLYGSSRNLFTSFQILDPTQGSALYVKEGSNDNTFKDFYIIKPPSNGIGVTGASTYCYRNKFISGRIMYPGSYQIMLQKGYDSTFSDVVGAGGSVGINNSVAGNVFVQTQVAATANAMLVNSSTTMLAYTTINTNNGIVPQTQDIGGSNFEQLFIDVSNKGIVTDPSTATPDAKFRNVALFGTYGLYIANATNYLFQGLLIVNGSTANCSISSSTGFNISGNGACTTPVGVTYYGTPSKTNTMVGVLTTGDSANANSALFAAGNGNLAFASITDWINFSRRTTTIVMSGGNFNACVSGGAACSLIDTGLKSDDTGLDGTNPVALNRITCPTAENYGTHTWSDASTTNYLRGAMEYSNGNNNGLCESGETCLYMPNLGYYQGHGSIISAAGTCSNIGAGGTIQNVTLVKYTSNGY